MDGVLDETHTAGNVPPGLPSSTSGTLPPPLGTGVPPLPGDVPEGDVAMFLKKMDSMHVDMQTEFQKMRVQLDAQAAEFKEFKQDLEKLRGEMVSKDVFQRLKLRVDNLEAGGLGNPKLTWLQQEVQRLDPANKS